MNNINRCKQIVVLSMLIGITSVRAVTVRQCPEKLTFTVSGVTEKADKNAALKDFTQLNLATATLQEKYEDKEYLAAEMAYETLKDSSSLGVFSSRTFSIKRRENGVCRYLSNENPDGEEKIEIYTKEGKDRIYLQTFYGPRGSLLRTYAALSSLEPTSITVEAGPYGVALAVPRSPYTSYYAGGPLGFIATAEKVEVSVAE